MSTVYAYHCSKCDIDVEMRKPMSLAERAEPCPYCRRILDRVYTPQHVGKFPGRTPPFHKNR